jgi:UDP-glucose 4-epimerase
MGELAESRILVIGGAGFIGSHAVELLLEQPVARVTVLDNLVRGTRANLAEAARDPRLEIVEGTIEDRDLLASLTGGADYVLHLAALWLGECVHDPRAALETNVVGTYNVLEAAQRAGVRRLVFSSSASVYGDALFVPMTEDHPFNNRTMYGATKIAGEQFLRAFHDQYGLDYVGLRYMNAYGPRMDDKGVYVSVIAKTLDRLDRGEAPVVFGDGSQSYDFVYVTDLARANVLALTADATDAVYNIGTGVPTTIRELVEELVAITGAGVESDYRAEATSYVTRRLGSVEAAERDLGFTAQVPWRQGLRELVRWRRQVAALAP